MPKEKLTAFDVVSFEALGNVFSKIDEQRSREFHNIASHMATNIGFESVKSLQIVNGRPKLFNEYPHLINAFNDGVNTHLQALAEDKYEERYSMDVNYEQIQELKMSIRDNINNGISNEVKSLIIDIMDRLKQQSNQKSQNIYMPKKMEKTSELQQALKIFTGDSDPSFYAHGVNEEQIKFANFEIEKLVDILLQKISEYSTPSKISDNSLYYSDDVIHATWQLGNAVAKEEQLYWVPYPAWPSVLDTDETFVLENAIPKEMLNDQIKENFEYAYYEMKESIFLNYNSSDEQRDREFIKYIYEEEKSKPSIYTLVDEKLYVMLGKVTVGDPLYDRITYLQDEMKMYITQATPTAERKQQIDMFIAKTELSEPNVSVKQYYENTKDLFFDKIISKEKIEEFAIIYTQNKDIDSGISAHIYREPSKKVAIISNGYSLSQISAAAISTIPYLGDSKEIKHINLSNLDDVTKTKALENEMKQKRGPPLSL